MRWEEEVRVLGVWWQRNGGWEAHVANRLRIMNMRWGLMKKMIGRGGRGVGVEMLLEVFKTVVKKAIMYGIEVFWNGQKEMRERLQVWINRGLSGILGAVRTTPVAAMLGEVGMKGVEYDLDEMVEKWGKRLIRRGFWERWGKG